MKDLLDLGGRAALVTGAGQGIGRAIALRLAEHGAGTVVVNDLFLDRAEQVAAEVRGLGAKALPVAADITDPAAVAEMAEAVLAKAGGVSIVVNNAGVLSGPVLGRVKLFEDSSIEDWEPWIRLNILGTMLVTRAFLPGMLESGWGRVVTIVSDGGRLGEPGLAPYCTAKAGAAGFMRTLALEVGKRGVTANCVAPGGIDHTRAATELPRELVEGIAARTPLGRIGEPEDVANMVLFLASDAASWITGQVYPVNGGLSFAL
jgi:3-oxoacyl-[acyl-carrier protein] reductase